MLAIGRALMSKPELLLLDEPSLGLAPKLVEKIFETILEINKSGVTIFLVEQNAHMALTISNTGFVMETGRIVLTDKASDLLENEQLVAAAGSLDTDDLADLIVDLPRAVIHEVTRSMDKQNRERLEAVLHYPEDTAGGLMNVDTVTVRADVTLEVVLRYLRLYPDVPEMTDTLFVVNRDDHYQGILRLSTLLTNDPERFVALIHEGARRRDELKQAVQGAGGNVDFPGDAATFIPKPINIEPLIL